VEMLWGDAGNSNFISSVFCYKVVSAFFDEFQHFVKKTVESAKFHRNSIKISKFPDFPTIFPTKFQENQPRTSNKPRTIQEPQNHQKIDSKSKNLRWWISKIKLRNNLKLVKDS
jgi:hypothetical protein